MASAATLPLNGAAPSIAAAAQVKLSPSTAGIFHVPTITPESAKAASDLLQENHVKNHIFFNKDGFHNHIAHHLLTIFALGANPSQLQHGFADNQSYQRPQYPVDSDVVEQMSSSREKLVTFCGQEKYFHDFEEFFGRQIENKGTKQTIDEWLFKGDDVAEQLLTRMFAGFYHPIIHFGFGLEFHQPAVLVESLAQAAIHDNWMSPFLLGCEKAAASSRQAKSQKSLVDLLQEARANDTIRNSPHSEDGNKVRDGVMKRAGQAMIDLASQWTVQPTLDDIRFKTAEMIQNTAYFTAGAMNAKKIPKFDFFYMHCINASIFYSSFTEDPQNQDVFGLTDDKDDGENNNEQRRKNFTRLLEMKGRSDVALYVSRGSPNLDMDRIRNYTPKHPAQTWSDIFTRACAHADDGHASKLVRAMANAERVCVPYEQSHNWPIRGEMWLKIGHMVIDSVEADGPRWVRNAGWEEAWSEVPDRGDAKL